MEVKNRNYRVTYRGRVLDRFSLGEWAFFSKAQRERRGYWLGAHPMIVFSLNLKGLFRCLMVLPTCWLSPELKKLVRSSALILLSLLKGLF